MKNPSGLKITSVRKEKPGDWSISELHDALLTTVEAAYLLSLATRPAMDWTRTLVAAGMPAGPIYAIDQVFADPQVVHSKMVEEVEHPVLGVIRQLANPLRMDAFGGYTVRIPPPLLGEHSEEILRGFGYPDDEIAAMIDSGVVGVAGEEAT